MGFAALPAKYLVSEGSLIANDRKRSGSPPSARPLRQYAIDVGALTLERWDSPKPAEEILVGNGAAVPRRRRSPVRRGGRVAVRRAVAGRGCLTLRMQGATRLCRSYAGSGGRSLLGRAGPCCRRHARRRRILPWPPGKSLIRGLAASAELPDTTPRTVARRPRTSQGGHVPGSYSAPRARALLASQRAAPQLVPDPALLIGDEAVPRLPWTGGNVQPVRAGNPSAVPFDERPERLAERLGIAHEPA